MADAIPPHNSNTDSRPAADGAVPALGLEQLVDFAPHAGENGGRYVCLDMDWAEWFYWMEELGEVHCWSTNGWGYAGRLGRFAGWTRLPGGTVWINAADGAEIDTARLGAILAVEDSAGDTFSLSCQVVHRNGHGHLKLQLTHESDLELFYRLVTRTATADPAPAAEESASREPVSLPADALLRQLWPGSCRAMPAETYPGLEPLARWTVLNRLGADHALPFPMGRLGSFFDRLVALGAGVRLDLYHPDHRTALALTPTRARGCACWWHLHDGPTQCHLPKADGLRAWAVSREPGSGATDWIEIYHRPSRRLLAWLRPGDDPAQRARWDEALAGIA